MTMNEYLINLAMQLQKIDTGDALYSDIKQAISFYKEMIEDMMEDGKSEEEAVASMEAPEVIAERMRREFILPSANKPGAKRPPAPPVPPAPPAPPAPPVPPAPPAPPEEDWGNDASFVSFQTAQTESAEDNYTRIRRVFEADMLTSIILRDSNNGVSIKRGGELAIEYSQNEANIYALKVEGGALKIKYIQKKKEIVRSIFSFGRIKGRREFVITIPESWHGALDVGTSNGAVNACGLDIESLTIKSSNGALRLEDLRLAGALTAASSNGNLHACDISAAGVDVASSNGNVNVHNISVSGQCRFGTSNGRAEAEDISAQGIGIATSNGGVKVYKLEAQAIKITSSNAGISGEISGRREDYTITSRTSNSSNKLGNTQSGARTLEVYTSNGKIDVGFMDEKQQ